MASGQHHSQAREKRGRLCAVAASTLASCSPSKLLDTGQWPSFLALSFSLASQVIPLGTRKGLLAYQSFFPGRALEMPHTMVSGAPRLLKE